MQKVPGSNLCLKPLKVTELDGSGGLTSYIPMCWAPGFNQQETGGFCVLKVLEMNSLYLPAATTPQLPASHLDQLWAPCSNPEDATLIAGIFFLQA